MNKWKNPEPAVPCATEDELDFYRETEQYELVLEICLPIVDNAPNDYLANYNLGNAYNDVDNYERAIATYDKILSTPKDDAEHYAYEILEYKGTAYFLLQEFEKAAACFKEAST